MCDYLDPRRGRSCLRLVLTTRAVLYTEENVLLIDQVQCPANDCSITSRIHENKVVDPVI